jgi:hypothetical protein
MVTPNDKKASFVRGKRNSQIAEEYVTNKYGFKIDPEEPLDSMKRNIEVKSCQMLLTDNHVSICRKGIFVLRKHQHNILLKKEGSYIFVLMHFNQIITDARIQADKIDTMVEWDNVGYCAIPWNKIIPYSEIFDFIKKAPPAELIPSKTFAKKMMGR